MRRFAVTTGRAAGLLSGLAAFVAAGAAAQQAAPAPSTPTSPPAVTQPLSPSELVANARPDEWRAIAANDLLIMTLTPDARGRERRAIIQLMPPPFSVGWVENIRSLARAHWWDGLAVVRVQDNYVTQWGDPDGEDAARARALPSGLRVMTDRNYSTEPEISCSNTDCEPEWSIQSARVPVVDSYSNGVGFFAGFPVGSTEGAARVDATFRGIRRNRVIYDLVRRTETGPTRYWPVHCYGMVGVGRGLSPDTGSGAELYTVIGHAPRHLDANIALVGRVIEGMQHLSSLPRGTGPLGFYETPEERTAITSIRLASDLPAAEQPRFEYLSTESPSFGRYADARANRRDPFFIRPAGGADICNIPVPVRRAAG
jgi:cyclophilin family peptidyl-prolyl cis-trans isomerase